MSVMQPDWRNTSIAKNPPGRLQYLEPNFFAKAQSLEPRAQSPNLLPCRT